MWRWAVEEERRRSLSKFFCGGESVSVERSRQRIGGEVRWEVQKKMRSR